MKTLKREKEVVLKPGPEPRGEAQILEADYFFGEPALELNYFLEPEPISGSPLLVVTLAPTLQHVPSLLSPCTPPSFKDNLSRSENHTFG